MKLKVGQSLRSYQNFSFPTVFKFLYCGCLVKLHFSRKPRTVTETSLNKSEKILFSENMYFPEDVFQEAGLLASKCK